VFPFRGRGDRPGVRLPQHRFGAQPWDRLVACRLARAMDDLVRPAGRSRATSVPAPRPISAGTTAGPAIEAADGTRGGPRGRRSHRLVVRASRGDAT
jgi:hypothetical protein